jgi:hypothetical protein
MTTTDTTNSTPMFDADSTHKIVLDVLSHIAAAGGNADTLDDTKSRLLANLAPITDILNQRVPALVTELLAVTHV